MKESKYPKTLKRWYKRNTGKILNLDPPTTYNEKIQWMKLHDSTAKKTELADKYRVRQYVAERVGEKYLIPLLGVWENADEMDFDVLPDRFVLKANHGCAWNIIVKDKGKLNFKNARKTLNRWLKMNYAFCGGLQLHYRDIKPLIIAEEYIEGIDLTDYKFLCFDGEVKYCYVISDRHKSPARYVYDLNWNKQPFVFKVYGSSEPKSPIDKPNNFDEMVECAKALCEGINYVRVDLYNANGRVYFGEMTFTQGSGTLPIIPTEYEKVLGDMIKLQSMMRG
jgi:hypothetical protein